MARDVVDGWTRIGETLEFGRILLGLLEAGGWSIDCDGDDTAYELAATHAELGIELKFVGDSLAAAAAALFPAAVDAVRERRQTADTRWDEIADEALSIADVSVPVRRPPTAAEEAAARKRDQSIRREAERDHKAWRLAARGRGTAPTALAARNAEIRAELEVSTITEVATRYGLSRSQVYAIKNTQPTERNT